MSKHRTLVIIPTYNEAQNIASFIEAVLGNEVDILVVDDNSPDKTGEIVKRISAYNKRVHVLSRAKKSGLGMAYRDGFRWGIQRNYDWFVSIDADFSHNPADIARLIAKSKETGGITIGSRYVAGGKIQGWNSRRHLMSEVANVVTKIFLGLKPKDVTAGFKCYPRSFVEQFIKENIVAPGYAFQVETLFSAHLKNIPIEELPITFSERRAGVSKVSGELSRAIVAVFRLMARQPTLRQLVKFGLVGFVNVAIDFGVLNILVVFVHMQPLVAGILSTLCALTNSYFLNRAWTFRGFEGSRGRKAEFAAFLAVNGSGAAVNWLIFAGLLKATHINYNIAKAIAIALTTFWNFFGSKKFVFTRSASHSH